MSEHPLSKAIRDPKGEFIGTTAWFALESEDDFWLLTHSKKPGLNVRYTLHAGFLKAVRLRYGDDEVYKHMNGIHIYAFESDAKEYVKFIRDYAKAD